MRLGLALPIVLALASCERTDPLPPLDAGLGGWERVASFELEDGSINDARRLSSGRILVRGYPNVLALYDSSGAFVRQVGRRGRGPGEYTQLDWAAEFGKDSIWAFDLNGQRLSLFDGNGGFLDSWELSGMKFGSVRDRFGDGTFLTMDPMMPHPPQFRGLGVESVNLRTVKLPEATTSPLRTIPMWTLFVDPANGTTLIGQPLGPEGVFAASDSTYWVGFGDEPVLIELARDGRELRRVPMALDPANVTDADRAEFLASPEPRGFAGMRALREAVPMPPRRAYFVRLLRDHESLWVGLERATDSTASRWVRVLPAPKAGDTLQLPAGHEVMQIDLPWLVVRFTARSGDEFVQLWRRRAP